MMLQYVPVAFCFRIELGSRFGLQIFDYGKGKTCEATDRRDVPPISSMSMAGASHLGMLQINSCTTECELARRFTSCGSLL